jgi:hypothetical protein
MIRLPSPAMCVAITSMLIALGGAGYSATGGNFLLGQSNTATTTTRLTASLDLHAVQFGNTNPGANASALGLFVATGKPPLYVNSTGKVERLNADLLDGLESHAFQRAGIENWHYINNFGEPPFENGWWVFEPDQINYAFPSFRKDRNGIVSLRGIIKGGAIGQSFFRLPAAYCPRTVKIFAAVSNNSLSRITIYPRPVPCPVFANFGSNAWVSLDGITYPYWGNDN